MTPEFPYVQLPGSFNGFFRKASLWEGIDHVLSISGTRFNEEYRRFYYRDIQVLIIENRAQAGSFGWWLLLLSLLIASLIVMANSSMRYSWVAFVMVLLLALIRLEISLRRSCGCLIQTAVSREPLPSLIRRSAARAAIARLQTRIVAEQGYLPADLPEQEDDIAATVAPPDPAQAPASEVLGAAAVRQRRTMATRGVNFAIAAFFILLFNAAYTFWIASAAKLVDLRTPTWVGYLFIFAGLIPVFLSLQSLGGLRALRGLRVCLVALIILSSLRILSTIVLSFTLQTRAVLEQGAPFQLLLSRYYENTSGALQFALAAIGLILTFAKWETYRRGEQSTS